MSITLRIKRQWKKIVNSGFLFVLPWILGFVIFTAGPMLFSLFISFFKWDYMRDLEFIGFANYIKAIFNDQYAINGMKLTIKFVTFAVPLQLALAILIASLLNTKLKGTKVVRTMVYLPVVLSGAVAGQMWKYMYSEDFGVINYFFKFLRCTGFLVNRLQYGIIFCCINRYLGRWNTYDTFSGRSKSHTKNIL